MSINSTEMSLLYHFSVLQDYRDNTINDIQFVEIVMLMEAQKSVLKVFISISGDNRDRILRGADPLADEQQRHPGGW